MELWRADSSTKDVGVINVLDLVTPSYCLSSASALHEEGGAKEYANVTLQDLLRVETLGMGGFGRVELVSDVGAVQFVNCCEEVFSLGYW